MISEELCPPQTLDHGRQKDKVPFLSSFRPCKLQGSSHSCCNSSQNRETRKINRIMAIWRMRPEMFLPKWQKQPLDKFLSLHKNLLLFEVYENLQSHTHDYLRILVKFTTSSRFSYWKEKCVTFHSSQQGDMKITPNLCYFFLSDWELCGISI